jgi:hypothetical protein
MENTRQVLNSALIGNNPVDFRIDDQAFAALKEYVKFFVDFYNMTDEIGYMTVSKNYCHLNGISVDDFKCIWHTVSKGHSMVFSVNDIEFKVCENGKDQIRISWGE